MTSLVRRIGRYSNLTVDLSRTRLTVRVGEY